MQIQHSIEGGLVYLPGLAKPKLVKVNDLPSDTAQELYQLITSTDFFNLPPVVGAVRRGSADMRSHILKIDDGNQSHTVKITEPIDNLQLKELVKKVEMLRT